ncbi:Oxygen sensor histidine kinase NreB [Aquisphaera giovannonii]|uniref:histidine kinase n=1 Tax=Aquisphaera giovannonii TaxID=406548 RepID=A0A5B9VX71_9BACT|nr:PAS domain S-box protein [Aquisphaera giovannonii]QEH32933.1 Oxygen sensor histidine kinase NreB [Aquisphaera giovannonii]
MISRTLVQRRFRYPFAVLTAALATAIRFYLSPLLDMRPGLPLPIAAAMLTSSLAGLGPGILCTIFCLFAWCYWFTEPIGELIPVHNADIVHLGLYTAVAWAICLWGSTLRDFRLQSARHAGLLDQAGDAIFTWEPGAGRIRSWNRAAERLYGFAAAEAIDRRGHSLLATLYPIPLEEIERILALEGEWSGELTHRTASGATVVVWSRMALAIGEDGLPLVMEANRDLTERKHAEAANAWLAAIIESSDDAIVGKDPDGVVTSWNRGAEVMFGFSKSEAIGRPITFLIPEDRIQEEVEILARLREGGRVDHFESVRRTKAGHNIDVSLTISPVKDAEGRMVGIAKTARDITDRKRVEEAVRQKRELQEQLASIAESVPGVLCSFRMMADGRASMPFATAAIEDLYGFSAAVLAEDFSPVYEHVHPEDAEEMRAGVREAFDAIGPWHAKFRYGHPSKGQRWVEGWAQPISSPSGSVLWHGFLMDVTERERAESARVELERESRSILDSIPSHIAVVDESGMILNVNRGWMQLGEVLGSSGRLPEGTNYLDACESAAGEAGAQGRTFAEGIRAVLAGQSELFQMEYPFHLHLDRRWFIGRVTPFTEGGPRRAVVSHHDVTALKLAEEGLRDRERMLKRSQAMAHLGSWVLQLENIHDPSVNALRWSDECYRIFGYEPGEVTVTNALYFDAIHPDDREPRLAVVAESVRTGRPYQLEHRIRRPDGEARNVHEWGEPVVGANGQALRLEGTCQDVTDIRLSEEALRQSQELLTLAVQSADLGVFDWDLSGSSIRWSPRMEELYGFPAGGFDGTYESYRERLFPADREDADEILANPGRTGERYTLEHRLVLPDGSTRWIATYGQFRLDRSKQLSRVSGVAMDITERRRSEEVLRNYASRLAHLRKVDAAILTARSSREIAEAALRHLSALIPCGSATVAMVDVERGQLVPIFTLGPLGDWYPAGLRQPLPAADAPAILCGWKEQMVVIDDVRETPSEHPAIRGLNDRGLLSLARIPLRDREEPIGFVLLAAGGTAAYTSAHLEVACEVSNQLAVAIHQASLFDELRATKNRGEELARRLLRAEDDERRRIARELHDEVGQTLAAAKILVDRVRSAKIRGEFAAEASDLIRHAMDQVRDVSRLLRPAALDFAGLGAALRALAEGVAERSGLALDLSLEANIGRVPPEVEIACYRIAQEALNNATKHAQAARLGVSLYSERVDLILVVSDDGRGFDVAAASADAERGVSLGLLSLAERAAMAGGNVVIESQRGAGTRIVARFTGGIDDWQESG